MARADRRAPTRTRAATLIGCGRSRSLARGAGSFACVEALAAQLIVAGLSAVTQVVEAMAQVATQLVAALGGEEHAERGTHDELLELGGEYERLHRLHMGGEAAA